MKRRLALLCLVAVLALPLAAAADWDPSQPAKWIQDPDLSDLGIDVNCSYDLILADDFQCMETGYITGIHIWGSWLDDYLPFGEDPNGVVFTLSIHADTPAGPGTFSMPGDVLWVRTFQPGEFTSRIWSQGTPEGWMDPPDQYSFPADWTCWQYNFLIPSVEAFHQLGTPSNPIVYWLDVKAEPSDGNARFGWKTSQNHWNDDAVWGVGLEPYTGSWFELRYPPGHDYYGTSIDLAFVVTGEIDQLLDWGDAPDGAAAPGYPTLAINNGANHMVGGPWLGDATDNPDTEPDGQPNAAALGDDNAGSDDEDGVQIPLLVQGKLSTITFEVNGANAFVEGWIDFNGDRIWQHPAEQVCAIGPVAPGMHAFTVFTPPGAIAGQTFARFRTSTFGGLPPWGGAIDGEVEDHVVFIHEQSKWLQVPDLESTGIDGNASDPYILADDFLCSEPGRIVEIKVWGSWLYDYLPLGDPLQVDFTLSFHADVPAGPNGYSQPGGTLWVRDFPAGTFTAEVWRDQIYEGWMDPPDLYFFPADHTCWLYTFRVPIAAAFFQAGSETEPIIYWLDVKALPHDSGARFGWKTSLDHWNDDAVWGTGFEPYVGPWYELRYPPVHQYAGQSIDLAFALNDEPTSGVPKSANEGLGLYQNQPNPFSSSTAIRYMLPADGGHARVEVFDVMGRTVARLVDKTQSGGMQSVSWNGRDQAGHTVTSGVYFCRLYFGDRVLTRTMMFLK
jgi:hypothetical protein